MRIAIISSVRSLNYGGCLQAYALGKIIKEYGKGDVTFEYLDYQRNYYKDSLAWLTRKILYGILHKDDTPSCTIREFVQTAFARKKNDYSNATDNFRKFWELTPCTAPLWRKDVVKLEDMYDLFIIGSDQNWNCGRLNLDKTLLLDFVKNREKKGSYAPSIGMKVIPEKYEKAYIANWKEFNYLSCRELSGAQLINSMIGCDVKWVLDPSLLLNKEQWEIIADKSMLDGQEYVLVYMLEESEKLLQFAKELAEQKKKKLKFIYGDISKNHSIGPQQWLGLFMGASYVVTNSFHGMAFSINFHKDFYVEIKKKSLCLDSSDRITGLLQAFNLQNRLLENENVPKIFSQIDYSYVDERLSKMRRESINYLCEMLNKSRSF